jgi:hypothetical protein
MGPNSDPRVHRIPQEATPSWAIPQFEIDSIPLHESFRHNAAIFRCFLYTKHSRLPSTTRKVVRSIPAVASLKGAREYLVSSVPASFQMVAASSDTVENEISDEDCH